MRGRCEVAELLPVCSGAGQPRPLLERLGSTLLRDWQEPPLPPAVCSLLTLTALSEIKRHPPAQRDLPLTFCLLLPHELVSVDWFYADLGTENWKYLYLLQISLKLN